MRKMDYRGIPAALRRFAPHVAVALGYVALYRFLRIHSYSHFILPAGLRVALLLLVPYRFWPAMAIGESGAISFVALTCWGRFGVLWSICMLIPPLPLGMPMAWYCRERLGVQPSKVINLGVTLGLGLACSMAWTLCDLSTYLIAISGKATSSFTVTGAILRWMLGNYVGVIAIAAPTLLLASSAMKTPRREWLEKFFGSSLTRESLVGYIPGVAILAYAGSHVPADMREVMQIMVFLPVAVAAFRHGARGAAFIGAIASFGVMYPMPHKYDVATVAAQLLVAFIASTMMLWSEHVGRLTRKAAKLHADAQSALALARRNVFIGEAQLRQTSQALIDMREQLGMNTKDEASPALDQLARLADWVYPQVWEKRGMPAGLHATLRQGELARVLDRAGVGYWCSFDGADLGLLPSRLNLLLYRLVVDSLSQMLSSREVNDVRVRLRHGVFARRRWVMLRIEGRARPERATWVRWDDLVTAFPSTATGDGISAIQDRVAAFEGTLRQRDVGGTRTLSVLMYEPAAAIAA